jgi:hypothetical protein
MCKKSIGTRCEKQHHDDEGRETVGQKDKNQDLRTLIIASHLEDIANFKSMSKATGEAGEEEDFIIHYPLNGWLWCRVCARPVHPTLSLSWVNNSEDDPYLVFHFPRQDTADAATQSMLPSSLLEAMCSQVGRRKARIFVPGLA